MELWGLLAASDWSHGVGAVNFFAKFGIPFFCGNQLLFPHHVDQSVDRSLLQGNKNMLFELSDFVHYFQFFFSSTTS